MSGDVVWGPTELTSTTTTEELAEKVRQALKLSGNTSLRLLNGSRELPQGVPLADAGVRDGATLSVIVAALRWPWSVGAARSFVEPHLQSHFERQLQWQRLRCSGAPALSGFVRGYVRRIQVSSGTPADPADILLPMLGLAKLELPVPLRERARKAESEETAAELVRDICAHAASLDAMWGERRLSGWPTKKNQQIHMGLLLAAHMHVVSFGTADASLSSAQVDATISALFASKPDCPLIRRELMALRFLDQKPLVSGTPGMLVLNAGELQSAMDKMVAAIA